MARAEKSCGAVVEKDGKVLMVHQDNGVFAFPKGHVEPGESEVETAVREIKEETGLSVKNVRYVASLSWPFPDQLMLAFRAEYAGGEITIQKDEIREAKFFPRDNLPITPPPGSVAWNLIHDTF